MAHSALQRTQADLPAALRAHPLLAELPDRAISGLARHASWRTLKPGEALPAREEKGPVLYYFVVEGQVGALRPGAARPFPIPPNRVNKNPLPGGDFLAFFRAGDVLSDGFDHEAHRREHLECVAVMASALVGVPELVLGNTLRSYPEWAERMREHYASIRTWVQAHSVPSLKAAQDFFLRHGYSFATTLKVIDLGRCINCDACEKACSDRHGSARLTHHGPILGRLEFPIACRTCVDHRCLPACGFDAISLLDGGEVKINQAKCVGCTACQMACPNAAINMVEVPFTVKDFPEPMPSTDLDGHTNVEGLYVVGEASGDALIKLAINSGRRAVEHARKSGNKNDDRSIVDVAVVGAGPSGLSAALTCMEQGLSYALFDKGTFATTIMSYPRHKVVMAEPAHIPLYGNLWLRDTTKEELISKWEEVIRKTGLVVRSNEEVKKARKLDDGTFEIETAKGKTRARSVILAIGKRGSPRKLGVKGEASPRVQYVLTAPEDFARKHIVVVGGGDSAVEAAMSLADVPGTTVALSYRRDSFGRIKAKNQQRLERYQQDGKVTVLLKSKITNLGSSTVTIDVEGSGPREIPNDVIFAMLGAEPPTQFLKDAGVLIVEPNTPEMADLARKRGTRHYANKCDHCAGHEDQACVSACPTGAIMEVKPSKVFVDVSPVRPHANDEDSIDDSQDLEERPSFREEPFREGFDGELGEDRFAALTMVVVFLSLLVTVVVGVECLLRRLMPEMSLLGIYLSMEGRSDEIAYSSGTSLGLTLGITGTALMALTALYPFRVRFRRLREATKGRLVLGAHVLAGVVGPILITYHTALKLDRWPSLAFAAMWMVVFSGMVGRYLAAWLRRSAGLIELDRIEIETEKKRLFHRMGAMQGKTTLFRSAEAITILPEVSAFFAPLALVGHTVVSGFGYAWLRILAFRTVSLSSHRRQALELFRERARNERRRLALTASQRSVGLWRKLHLGMTIAMFLITVAHIALAMAFKAA